MAISLFVVMFAEFCFLGWLLASTADNWATMAAVSESVSRFSAVPTETILLDLRCRSTCPGLMAYVTTALLGLVLPLFFCGVHLQSCFMRDPRLICPASGPPSLSWPLVALAILRCQKGLCYLGVRSGVLLWGC